MNERTGVKSAGAGEKPSAGALAFIGTQGEGPGEGIVAVRLDEESGALTNLGVVAEAERATWLLADPERPILYATSEVGNAGDREGAVLSFRIENRGGALRQISRTGSGGGGATHLALSRNLTSLFVANFGGGGAASVPVDPGGALLPFGSLQQTNGSGPHRRQKGPHPHGVAPDPSGGFLLVPDMGADRVFIFRLDADERRLSPAEMPYLQLPPGSGPRLLVFDRRGRFAYLLTELSAEVFVLEWDRDSGRLTQKHNVKLDRDNAEHDPSAAAIQLSPDGRHLYVSNRGDHTLRVYAIDPETGSLTEFQRVDAGGERPWSLDLSPSGRWLMVANQGSNIVSVFAVDRNSGRLSSAGQSLHVRKPVSVCYASEIVLAQLG